MFGYSETRHNGITRKLASYSIVSHNCDIDHITHKQVEDYLKRKYGDDKVCHIANFGRFGTKTIVKDLCRVFELDFDASNRLTAYFDPYNTTIPVGEALEKARELALKSKDSKTVTFIDDNKDLLSKHGDRMVGMVRQVGRHASGILISNNTLSDSDIPIYRLKGEYVTGVPEGAEGREVSELGYLKLDILGLVTATINNETIRMVENRYGIENLEQQLLKSNFDDEQVYEQFAEGNCKDIFQFGTDQMVGLIKAVKPKSIYDLSVVNALYRPGAIEAGGIDEYLKNRKDPSSAKYKIDKIHPDIWPVLEESCGVMIYQEQTMFLFQKIGGFTLAQADETRKILKLSKNEGNNPKYLAMVEKFAAGAKQKGIKQSDITKLVDIMAAYSKYSFNKSHSVSYAINAYISMWLKVKFPKEYYATLLNYSDREEGGLFIKQAQYDGAKFGKFLYGEVREKFEVDYDADIVRYGLNNVKGIKTSDIPKIVNSSVTNMYELVEYVQKQKITKKTIEVLCRLGFFSSIIKNDKLLEAMLLELRASKKLPEDFTKWAGSLEARAKELEDWDETEKYQFQKEYLGFYFKSHPFTEYYEILSQNPDFVNRFVIPKQIDAQESYKNIKLLGIVNSIVLKKSKNTGKEYYRLIIEDDLKQIGINVWEANTLTTIQKGNLVVVIVSNNKFGFSKDRNTFIEKLI